MTSPEAFFTYARERQAILLRRRAGLPRSSWTTDPIFQQFRFCNVFREDDRTTQWFRVNVRERVEPEQLLLATTLFRWFNRITTGEAIFSQLGPDRLTAWDTLRGYGVNAIPVVRDAILAYCGKGPYVTGSYIIKTPDGMNKLDGVLWCIGQFITLSKEIEKGSLLDQGELNRFLVRRLASDGKTQVRMEEVWAYLRQFPYLGDFMAYEIVTDLDQTFRFPDRMTWANPGPGAARGLGRLFHGDKDHYRPNQKTVLNPLMRGLLVMSKDPAYWPQQSNSGLIASDAYRDQTDCIPSDGTMLWGWPAWDMRTVEHTLCEFDKYERVRTGEGRPRQVFR